MYLFCAILPKRWQFAFCSHRDWLDEAERKELKEIIRIVCLIRLWKMVGNQMDQYCRCFTKRIVIVWYCHHVQFKIKSTEWNEKNRKLPFELMNRKTDWIRFRIIGCGGFLLARRSRIHVELFGKRSNIIWKYWNWN